MPNPLKPLPRRRRHILRTYSSAILFCSLLLPLLDLKLAPNLFFSSLLLLLLLLNSPIPPKLLFQHTPPAIRILQARRVIRAPELAANPFRERRRGPVVGRRGMPRELAGEESSARPRFLSAGRTDV